MGCTESDSVLSLAALGRPFRLGMLYDSRSEALIPGITLWDQATLENRTVQQQESSEFHILCSDSLDEKASSLDVKASLKLSFLCGLVNIEGGAKYLQSTKSTSHQERVTLQYKCTTRTETMTMEQLAQGRIQHPQVLDHGTATHVVTSIMYGANAFFVFERDHSLSSTETNVDGNVHAIIDKIPATKIDGKGELHLSDNEKKVTDKLSCRFFGDFTLPKNPSCYDDAVKVYQNLPSYLGEKGEKAGPIKIWLYPLSRLDSRATRLVRDISSNLIGQTESFFEEINTFKVNCNDMLLSDAAKHVNEIQLQINKFVEQMNMFKLIIETKLFEVLPKIRGGGEDEVSLTKILESIGQSPFCSSALRSWVNNKKTQIKVLNEYARALADINCASEPGDIESVILKPENIHGLCFTIYIPTNDAQLQEMELYNKNKNYGKFNQDDNNVEQIKTNSMIEVANVFRNFYDCSKSVKGQFFLRAHECSKSDEFHASVNYYRYGKLVNKNYELPSHPENVIVIKEDTTHNRVTISWKPPKYGTSNIISYVVGYRQKDLLELTAILVNKDDEKVSINDLIPGTEYVVQVRARCEVGDGPPQSAEVYVRTMPASQPKMLTSLKISSTGVLLKWRAPACIANNCKINNYILYQETNGGQWTKKLDTISSEPFCKLEVNFSTVIRVKVVASCGSAGESCISDIYTIDISKPLSPNELKEVICANSRVTQVDPTIYMPEMTPVSYTYGNTITKMEFGERKINSPEKIIMLVGATGSGKTTMINGFVNYIFGVEWKDKFRFKIIEEANVGDQSVSQTSAITSYTLHHLEGFRVPYTVTIIDTPGFGDVSGIMQDKKITEDIRKFFTDKKCPVTHIDAVGFVANSSLPRLTATQKYIFDQVLSLFGKDIKENIFLLLTFADGKEPQVLSSIKAADLPYKKHFKFNNSALFAHDNDNENNSDSDDDEENDDFDEMFWNMGFKSFRLFMKQLNFVESKSLMLTKDVLNERNSLELYVTGLQREIRLGLSTLERLKKEKELLQDHFADIERNKDFEYEVEEEVYVQKPIPPRHYVTNCIICNRTCHEDCAIPEDINKDRCWAMTNGSCRICPEKCSWRSHKNFPFKYILERKKTKKTFLQLRERYEEATEKKLTTVNVIEEISNEFDALQFKVLEMTDNVRKCLEKLQEIALRQNPLSTVKYIDILIETEKGQAEPGWAERVEQLKVVQKHAEYMEMIAKDGFDPFKEYREKLKLTPKMDDKIINRVYNYCKKQYKKFEL